MKKALSISRLSIYGIQFLALVVLAGACFWIADVSAAGKRKQTTAIAKSTSDTGNRRTAARGRRPVPRRIAKTRDDRGIKAVSIRNPFADHWNALTERTDGVFGESWREEGREEKSKRADEPDKAFEYFLQKRLPEGEKELPFERYVEAMETMQQMPLYSTADNRMVQSRAELLNPDQQKLGTWTWLGPGNIGGRTRTIVFNPQNPAIMYTAGVSGGVWKSTDAGQSWTPISDRIANIPVSALALEPGNPSVIYAGTGEGFVVGSQNGVNITGAHRGLGIYKSTDAGANWTRLEQTTNPDFYYINDIVISSTGTQRVYAATETGVWRSTDSGTTWTRVHNPSLTGGCLDLAIRTDQMTDVLFAACGTRTQARVYRNIDAGGNGSWAEVLSDTGMGRTVLAIAPSNQNTIYALSTAFTGTFTNSLHAVFRSTTGGEAGSFVARVRNTDPNKLNRAILSNIPAAMATDCKISTADSISGQGWYDLAMAVDPVDENRVWAGGIDLARSDDGGANWGIAGFAYAYISSSLVYSRPNQIHPDQHFITFHPQYNGTTNQQMYIGNDGGIWRTDNARATVGTGPTGACDPANSAVRFVPLNNNYGVTQFYHGTVAPDGKSYFGGTQDNGTLRGTDADGPNKWQSILLADGGYSAIDFRNPTTLYASTQGGGFRKSTDNGLSFSSATLGLSAGALLFITPLAMDPSDSQRLYTGGDPVSRTDTGMSTWTSMGSLRTVSGSTGVMSAVAVSPTDSNWVMWGMNDGSIVRTTRALSLNPSNPISATIERATRPRTNAFVSWVGYDPNDKRIAYATYSTFGGPHVYRTTNGGESWTSIDGTGTTGLPDIPVHCVVVDRADSARLYVGTDLGVFVTTDTGATWSVENTGFANVLTESLALNTVNGMTSLYAFTHGRGVFKVTASTAGCNYSLARSGSRVGQNGSDLTVEVGVAGGSCVWKAESNASWITVQPGAGGSASGTVGLKVEANRNFGIRIGTVTIAGRSFNVTQEGVTDIESPTLRIATPTTPTVNTTTGSLNVAGTAADNQRVASVTWRTNRGLSGTAGGTTNWAIAGLPLLTGQNEISIAAVDDAGNISGAATLIVNSTPAAVLSTIAGNGVSGLGGDNGPAVAANLGNVARLATDAGGNLYIAEFATNRVRKVAPNGVITTIAGTGVSGFSGDNGPGNQAQLNLPVGVAVDAAGNVFISDYGNQRVRRVAAGTGIITTVVGTGVGGYSGDGGPAKDAQINSPEGLGVDKAGNLYIADSNNFRIRKVDASTGAITTVVGTGTQGFSGDDGPAGSAQLGIPYDVAFDASDNLYISDGINARIRRVTANDGIIRTIVGLGGGFGGDGGPAKDARIGIQPLAIKLDTAGNLYIADLSNQRIRVVAASTQIITTVTGTGVLGFTPDGAGASGARIGAASGVAVDAAGLLIFGDRANNRVRKIIPGVSGDTAAPALAVTSPTISNGMIMTSTNPFVISGTATDNGTVIAVRWSNDRGGSGAAIGTTSWSISDIGLFPGLNNLTITAWDVSGNAGTVRVAATYETSQVLVTLAGTGALADTGDSGPGYAAALNEPRGVAIDSKGNIYIADTLNRRVRRIAPNGTISAFAGTGNIGSGGDGGPAAEATINIPNAVAVDKADNVYISDQFANRIRKVTPDGKISTVAGTGEGFGAFTGDGGPATQASLNGPVGIAVDNSGNLFIADRQSQRIRRVDAATGVITSVAGSGRIGFAGDGGPATEADLFAPSGVAVDGAGNVYIADTLNQRIRRVSAADGKISTIAGTGVAGFSGDGGPASSALINITYPASLTVNAAGELYFADRGNHRIRRITLSTGVITTVAGTGAGGFNGDGTAPLGTALFFPSSVALDSTGNMIIADSGNNRVRRVRPASSLRTISAVSAASFSMTAGLAAEEIGAAFGTNLAGSTAMASSLPLPTSLAGTTVRIRDNVGVERLAPLFFVSSGQVNFIVPSGTANGLATITITNSSGDVLTGTAPISTIAPSLFSANANGNGVASAVVLRRNASGQDRYEPVAQLDSATNRFVPVPIDLGLETDQLFLIVYGSGFRSRTALTAVTTTIGGVAAPVLFAGPAPGLVGADQLNLRLDRSLAGKGAVDLVFSVDGKAANTVQVTIK